MDLSEGREDNSPRGRDQEKTLQPIDFQAFFDFQKPKISLDTTIKLCDTGDCTNQKRST